MMIFNHKRAENAEPRLFRAESDRPLAMLKQCPAYAPTPLRNAPALADEFGVASLRVKDESERMRLGSFKALGGAFAVAQMISEASGGGDLLGDHAKGVAAGLTFVTASAGNHGLSVAAGARVFGAKAAIVLSNAVPEGFANRIRALGADVIRAEGSYEDSVAHAMQTADANGWLHLADGSWDGYIERPALIVEGYTVLAEECRTEFASSGDWPTHIFLQAGVGGLAAAVAAHVREHWARQPTVIVVEPDAAPCLLASAKAGALTRVDGPVSNMGRLDCKEASLITFDSLRRDVDVFVTITDAEAQAAADTLAKHGIDSTPSGVAGFAALKAMEIDADARCLLIVSEGPEGE